MTSKDLAIIEISASFKEVILQFQQVAVECLTVDCWFVEELQLKVAYCRHPSDRDVFEQLSEHQSITGKW